MKYKLFCLLFLILLALITLLFSKNNIIKRSSKEIHELKNYKKSCEKGVLLSKNKFKRIQNPKISIISAVYNRGKYIKRFLRSIQNQLFNEIEIIFVDDFSTDNSVQIIEKFQKEDERIILIKHNKNKGTLISRNDGILKSKGEYLIFPDPDDILSNDILKYCYNESHRNNYDIIRFNIYDRNKYDLLNLVKILQYQKVYQPQLSFHIFYSKGYLEQTDYSISNKFIKRNLLIKTINSINKYYLLQNMIVYEDGLINYMLYKCGNSLYHSKKIAYYYIQNKQSITKNFKKNIERNLKDCYLYLKFIFEYTKNNYFEKNIASLIYKNVHLEISNISQFQKITKDFDFYYNVINLYINNKFIPYKDKNELINILKVIKKNKYKRIKYL